MEPWSIIPSSARGSLQTQTLEGGYPAEQAGVISIPVRGPDETKRVIEAIIACLDDSQQARAFKVPSMTL
jgi:hypothetical protein